MWLHVSRDQGPVHVNQKLQVWPKGLFLLWVSSFSIKLKAQTNDYVDDEYSYSNHDFGAGGSFSFGGVTVSSNRHDDDDEEEEAVLTSMNANEFQYGSYYNAESDEDTEEEDDDDDSDE